MVHVAFLFHSGTTWAPRGQTPVIKVTGARFSLNMIGAIGMRGQLRFMVVKGSVTAEHICDLLTRLMHGAEKPVFLIWDGHPIHRAGIVQECIDSFGGKLEVYKLPSYSPELNPTEQVWNNVKNHGIGIADRIGINYPDKTVLQTLFGGMIGESIGIAGAGHVKISASPRQDGVCAVRACAGGAAPRRGSWRAERVEDRHGHPAGYGTGLVCCAGCFLQRARSAGRPGAGGGGGARSPSCRGGASSRGCRR